MMKKRKRFLSLLLAGVLCLSMTMTAFATETDGGQNGQEVTQENTQAETDEQSTVDGANSQETTTDTQEESTDQTETSTQTDSQVSTQEETQTESVQGTVTQDVEETKEPVKGEVKTNVEDDNVVVEKDDKPYLALGADLTPEQQATVLSLMGISQSELTNYDIVYVTNDMEHQYLDSYLPASTIGTKALSSVLIMEGKKGSGIQISTKNISYCTVGMYKNALATAGLEDAEIIVAGPFPISGTAALIGALQAYSKMTGDEIKEESLDTAMNELVVTGELADAVGGDKAQAEEFMAYVKQEVVKNGLDDEASINEAIDKACKEFNVTLTESQKQQLLGVMKKISDLDLDWDQLLNQASDLYDRLDEMGLLSDNGFLGKIKDFFRSIKEFFQNLFE
ncbi:MAG: DUF1002 domain-containing protein [Lachnospiraceae bacterium]